MTEDQDCVRCITGIDGYYSFCGVPLTSVMAFIDVDHAIRTRLQFGRQLVCKKCIVKIEAILDNED